MTAASSASECCLRNALETSLSMAPAYWVRTNS